jgi:hypothetical protein
MTVDLAASGLVPLERRLTTRTAKSRPSPPAGLPRRKRCFARLTLLKQRSGGINPPVAILANAYSAGNETSLRRDKPGGGEVTMSAQSTYTKKNMSGDA